MNRMSNFFIQNWIKQGENDSKTTDNIILKYGKGFKRIVLLFLALVFGLIFIAIYEIIKSNSGDGKLALILFSIIALLIIFYLIYASKKVIIFKKDTFYVKTLFSNKTIKYSDIVRVKQDPVEGVRVYTKDTNFFINIQLTNYQLIYDKLKEDFLKK